MIMTRMAGDITYLNYTCVSLLILHNKQNKYTGTTKGISVLLLGFTGRSIINNMSKLERLNYTAKNIVNHTSLAMHAYL